MNKRLSELLGIEPRANCHHCPNGMCIYQAIEGHEKECEIPVNFQDPENIILLLALVRFYLNQYPEVNSFEYLKLDEFSEQKYIDALLIELEERIVLSKKHVLSFYAKFKQQAAQQTWKR